MGFILTGYSIVYVDVLNCAPTRLRIVLERDNEGKVVEIEGLLPVEVNTVTGYHLIPVSTLTSLLY